MRKSIIIMALSLCAVSCSKQTAPLRETPDGPSLTVTVEGAVSKATAEGETAKVNSLQVFIYDEAGALDGAGMTTGTSLKVNCTSGLRTVRAVVNAAEIPLSSVQTLAELDRVTADLADQKADSFTMTGSTDTEVKGDSEVTVIVRRIAARVIIRKVTNRLEIETLREKPFTLRAVYLLNVQGRNNLSSTGFQPGDGIWYNRMRYQTSPVDSLLHEEVGEIIPWGASHEAPHYFYGFPNNYNGEDVYSGEWSPRYTRLVVEMELDGKVYYYHIAMNKGFESNTSYEIDELVITKVGSDDPDKPVTSFDVPFRLEVKPWTVILMGSGGQVVI